MLGGLLKGLERALTKALGGINPWTAVGLALAPKLLGIGRGAGKKAAYYESQLGGLADWMRKEALMMPKPTMRAPFVWQSLAAEASRARVNTPAGVVLPGANELLRASMMARAQQATALQQLMDEEAMRNWYAQRLQLASGAPDIYRSLADLYRQQQAGQLSGWGQMVASILARK